MSVATKQEVVGARFLELSDFWPGSDLISYAASDAGKELARSWEGMAADGYKQSEIREAITTDLQELAYALLQWGHTLSTKDW